MKLELINDVGEVVRSFAIRAGGDDRPAVIIFEQTVFQFREQHGDAHRYQFVPFAFIKSSDDVQMLTPTH